MSFKENLYRFRMESGMSQQELADKVGVSQRSICAYELGVRTPTIEVLTVLAKVFDCTADELLNSPKGTNPKTDSFANRVATAKID